MILHELSILNYKNIREASLTFSDKLNCLVGLNGQGKTNVLDAIYMLSFTKSAFNSIDSQNITHGQDMSMVQGRYADAETEETITCGIKRGVRKQFRRGRKDYSRLTDHIGLVPLVMTSPEDGRLIEEGSDERRRFLDSVIAQYDRNYLEQLTRYNTLLKQRNAMLKQLADHPEADSGMLEVYEQQMIAPAETIFTARGKFMEGFVPLFRDIHAEISGGAEEVHLQYISQLQDRDLAESFVRTRSRDIILGWTSQGVHKDELDMKLGEHLLRRTGSQGQQKTFLIAMKLAQALYLGKPILLLDDIFDKLDAERVRRIIQIVSGERFGQIFLTDTDRQHLSAMIAGYGHDARLFSVTDGVVTPQAQAEAEEPRRM